MANYHKSQPEGSLPIEELSALMREQSEDIKSLKTQLSNQLKKEIANSTKQLEAHQGMQALLGDLPGPFHSWPISPDFAFHLARSISDQNYNLIINLAAAPAHGSASKLASGSIFTQQLNPNRHPRWSSLSIHWISPENHWSSQFLRQLSTAESIIKPTKVMVKFHRWLQLRLRNGINSRGHAQCYNIRWATSRGAGGDWWSAKCYLPLSTLSGNPNRARCIQWNECFNRILAWWPDPHRGETVIAGLRRADQGLWLEIWAICL